MAKYRNKPVVIEAVQYLHTPESRTEIIKFMSKESALFSDTQGLFIPTLEGNMTASKNDWIIKGVNGEFYPCKPDIFEKTYERVEPTAFELGAEIRATGQY
jgi:hypothetical protein